MRLLVALLMIGVSTTTSCRKAETYNYVDFVGYWESYPTGKGPCTWAIEINANQTANYHTGGSSGWCGFADSGSCQIENDKLLIGDKKFDILAPPQSIPDTFITNHLGGVETKRKMRLKTSDDIFSKVTLELYKAN
jgi:hypothetical protein